jgi:hypothetical protein
MSLFINGTIPKEDEEYIKEYLKYLIDIGSIKDGDNEDYVHYSRGARGIYKAIDLWNLVDQERSDKINKMLREEIKSKTNKLFDEEGECGYLISIPQIKRMLELIEGFREALVSIMDKYGKVYPDKVKYVQEKDPYILVERTDGEGNIVYWLDEPIWYANTVVWFFKLALKLNREITTD